MFGVGWTEILVILVVALLVLGPSKLPDIAKGLGKGIRDFRKAMSSLDDDPTPAPPTAWSTPATPPAPQPVPPASLTPPAAPPEPPTVTRVPVASPETAARWPTPPPPPTPSPEPPIERTESGKPPA
jgi:TatA/E family protein of Tat protein translocase